MRWRRPNATPPRRQPSPSPAEGDDAGALESGCYGTCLGVLASVVAFIGLLTLGSILAIFERPDRGALAAWGATLLASWALSGVVAYVLAGWWHASALAMGLGALVGFVMPVVALVVLT